jgi:hypothetical protein
LPAVLTGFVGALATTAALVPRVFVSAAALCSVVFREAAGTVVARLGAVLAAFGVVGDVEADVAAATAADLPVTPRITASRATGTIDVERFTIFNSLLGVLLKVV